METITAGAILKEVASYGVLGLGWVLALYMIRERNLERKKYSDLVIHIVSYFTKVNMVERNADALGIPPGLYGDDEAPRKIASFFGREADRADDEEIGAFERRSRGSSQRRGSRGDE